MYNKEREQKRLSSSSLSKSSNPVGSSSLSSSRHASCATAPYFQYMCTHTYRYVYI
jgi:hypothetical protein